VGLVKGHPVRSFGFQWGGNRSWSSKHFPFDWSGLTPRREPDTGGSAHKRSCWPATKRRPKLIVLTAIAVVLLALFAWVYLWRMDWGMRHMKWVPHVDHAG